MAECNRRARYDANGDRVEERWIGGQLVVVHHSFLPDEDRTEVDGIPCTTPLRTVLDLAPDLPPDELDEMVRTCLERGLFTVEQACERMVKPDMILRPGPALLTDSLTRVIGWR